MRTQLYVYTGTGNSLWTARQLVRELKDASLHSMPSLSEDFEVRTEGIGIIFPVHIWGLPRRVIQFVKHLRVKPGTYFFALAVNAGQVAGTLLQLQRLLSTHDMSLALGYSIVLPSNYIPWGGPGPFHRQQRLFGDAKEKLRAVAEAIFKSERRMVERGPFWQNVLFTWFYKMSLRSVSKLDKNFWADEGCNSCGVCSEVCPAENIEIANEKPAWLHRCEQCLACIQWCPQEAIQYGKKTARYPRYHHHEVTLQDVLDQAKANRV